jgi:hypothetical protein
MLTQEQIARLDAVVHAAEASANEAAKLADTGVVAGIWASLIGAGSTTDAIKANAYAAASLYASLYARSEEIRANPDATEADVVAFEGGSAALSNAPAAEAVKNVSIGEAYRAVVAQTFKDIAPSSSTLRLIEIGLIVGAGLLLYLYGRSIVRAVKP